MAGGRPTKYEERFNEMARKVCLLGATDSDIADLFQVDESTINNWKIKHPEFLESILRGKLFADMEVADALYKGTQDRTVIEQQAFKVRNQSAPGVFDEEIKVVEVEKIIPADFRNQQFWLKNRQSSKWRDKQEVGMTNNEGKDVVPTVTVFQIPDNGRNSQ